MTLAPLICLITPGHVASTPRLVKSADALAEAGYRVHVISGAPFAPADRLDGEILLGAKWGHTRLNTRQGPSVFIRKILRRMARRRLLLENMSDLGIAARSQFAESAHLARQAARIPAQLFIGHSIAALYPAASAAISQGSAYGFDIEDYHDAETDEAMADPVERRARFILQSNLLPEAKCLTCSAPLISRKYQQVYNVTPNTVLNVFPRSQAPSEPASARTYTEDKPVVFYWFSQTIGHGRGLEKAINVIGRMRTPAVLHLRGFTSSDYSAHLQTVADKAGLKRPIRFLAPASPNEMARLASLADIGLCVEERAPLNHDICLANKIFVYLLAGIPQILSCTTAHSAFAPELRNAALLCDMTRADESAARLDSFFSDTLTIENSRSEARKLARNKYSWDLEKEILLRSVNNVVPFPL